MKSKGLLKSKTVIFNSVVFIAPIIALFAPQVTQSINDALPADIAPHVATIFTAIVALINVWLRTRTTQPVRMSLK